MFIMPFKHTLIMIAIMLSSASVYATSWEEALYSRMLKAYDALEQKYVECRNSRKPVEKSQIKSEWFNNLSQEDRAFTIQVLSRLATDRCVEDEEAKYSKALLSYASETDDLTKLEEWMRLKKLYVPNHSKPALEQLDMKEVQVLSESEPFLEPFFPLQVFELYN